MVSFKLETDERLLVPKAAAALERYGVHLVVRPPRLRTPSSRFTHSSRVRWRTSSPRAWSVCCWWAETARARL